MFTVVVSLVGTNRWTHPPSRSFQRDRGGLPPEGRREQHGIVRLLHLFVLLLGSLAPGTSAFRAEACFVVHASSQLIPQLEEESSVVGLVNDGYGVMAEVLEGGIDDGIVGPKEVQLEAPVQVYPIPVEEEGEDSPQKVQVHRHDQGYYENWCGPH